jgi:predicted nucleotidyltransferase
MQGDYFLNQRTSKMDKKGAIEKVKAYKSLLKKHIPLEKIYMFGSYAKDKYRDDSDIDVAIVVKKMEGDFFSIHPWLWRLRRQIDDRIEPVLIERDFDDAGFLEEILKNGIEVS